MGVEVGSNKSITGPRRPNEDITGTFVAKGDSTKFFLDYGNGVVVVATKPEAVALAEFFAAVAQHWPEGGGA